jgi:hypothetical protein
LTKRFLIFVGFLLAVGLTTIYIARLYIINTSTHYYLPNKNTSIKEYYEFYECSAHGKKYVFRTTDHNIIPCGIGDQFIPGPEGERKYKDRIKLRMLAALKREVAPKDLPWSLNSISLDDLDYKHLGHYRILYIGPIRFFKRMGPGEISCD